MSSPHRDPGPPPEQVLRSLMSAGVSQTTAKAMAHWKAREVLDLLHGEVPPPRPQRRHAHGAPDGTI